MRTRLDSEIDREAIAARHAAGRIDDHGLELAPARAGATQARRTLLVEARALRHACRELGGKADAPARPVGGEDLIDRAHGYCIGVDGRRGR